MIGPVPTGSAKPPSSISTALVRVRELESLNLPDAVVPLRDLSWTPEGTIVIPSYGEARPNDWARHQLSNLLGIRFDVWFASASPKDRAEEMSRRLRVDGLADP
jgi:hypothetical protein